MSVSVSPSLYQPHRLGRRLAGPIFGALCLLATLTGVAVLAILLGSVFSAVMTYAPAESWSDWFGNLAGVSVYLGNLLTRLQSTDPESAGFRAGVVGSLWLLGMVACFSIPVGVGAAVYLEEYAPPGRLKRLIQTNIANLAGVPSIVYGILGLAFFYRAFGWQAVALGPTLWSGALTLSLLILPTIVITTGEALRTVPSSLRQAAVALGATRWQVIRDHVLPASVPGILTGTILALSRAIGETAPLLMVGAAGSLLKIPRGPGSRYTALPVEIYNYAKQPEVEFQTVAAGGILLLLALLITMNSIAIVIRNRSGRHSRS